MSKNRSAWMLWRAKQCLLLRENINASYRWGHNDEVRLIFWMQKKILLMPDCWEKYHMLKCVVIIICETTAILLFSRCLIFLIMKCGRVLRRYGLSMDYPT